MGRFQTREEAEAAGVYISEVKSFVKREGRLTKGQGAALEEFWPTMGLNIEMGMLNFASVFGNDNPVVLEIGFGMGKSLVEMAQNAPELNFIGIEVHRPGVGACLMDAGELGLTNLRVFEHDAIEVLAKCIPEHSLHRLQLYFPDPWHKKRHHKRRIVQTEFAQNVHARLTKGERYTWQRTGSPMLNTCLKSCKHKLTIATPARPTHMLNDLTIGQQPNLKCVGKSLVMASGIWYLRRYRC